MQKECTCTLFEEFFNHHGANLGGVGIGPVALSFYKLDVDWALRFTWR